MPRARSPVLEASYQRTALAGLLPDLIALLGDANIPKYENAVLAHRILDLLDNELPPAERVLTTAPRPKLVAALRYQQYKKAHHRAEAHALAIALQALLAVLARIPRLSRTDHDTIAKAKAILAAADAAARRSETTSGRP